MQEMLDILVLVAVYGAVIAIGSYKPARKLSKASRHALRHMK